MLVAAELEPVERALQDALGLGEPFRDPGVGMFGLRNAVFALGDCFIEVVSPISPTRRPGRYLQRHGGDGGYMVLFDLEDLEGARGRAARDGVRVVWQIDLPDISGTHLHPADMRGAIVSIDRSRPYGTWRWGGPQWTGRTGSGAPGASPASRSPSGTRPRWPRAGRTCSAFRCSIRASPRSRSRTPRSASSRRPASAAKASSRSRSPTFRSSPASPTRSSSAALRVGGVRLAARCAAG